MVRSVNCSSVPSHTKLSVKDPLAYSTELLLVRPLGLRKCGKLLTHLIVSHTNMWLPRVISAPTRMRSCVPPRHETSSLSSFHPSRRPSGFPFRTENYKVSSLPPSQSRSGRLVLLSFLLCSLTKYPVRHPISLEVLFYFWQEGYGISPPTGQRNEQTVINKIYHARMDDAQCTGPGMKACRFC